ncbi:MAG: hypothetical protein ACP5RZ_01460 [Thermoplasmata archaeon]
MFRNTLLAMFSYALIALALIFYTGWGMYYNAWTDVGLFSFVSVIIVFGILGVLLARMNEKDIKNSVQ